VKRDRQEEWTGQLGLFEDNDSRSAPVGRNILVFDLETQRSFQEVGGRSLARQLGLSVGIVWSFRDQSFTSYFEPDVERLVAALAGAEQVIGYNLLGFDYEVLKGYSDVPLERTPTLDIMVELQQRLGFRPKLDSVVGPTLGAGKSADGLQALQWYREGRLDLIEQYCTEDVRLTRDLYLFGRRNRYVLVARSSGAPMKVPVSW
jgi:DEAD/DEAH box helicase domain-containing protein